MNIRHFQWPDDREHAALESGCIHVWRINLDRREPAFKMLDARERHRASQLRDPLHVQRFVAAHVMLREILGAYSGCPAAFLEISQKESGKPRLLAPFEHIEFSLTHSRDIAVVAVTQAVPVGIDIEHVRDVKNGESLIPMVTQKNSSHPCEFFERWTRSEAFFKTGGATSDLQFSTFELEPGVVGTLAWAGEDNAQSIDPFTASSRRALNRASAR